MTELATLAPSTAAPSTEDPWVALWHRSGNTAIDPAHDVFHTLLLVITCIELALQFYVVFLMFRVAADQLHDYRFYMLLCTGWDMMFVVCLGVLLKPRLLLPLWACISVHGLPEYFGNEGALITFALTFFAGVSLIEAQYYALAYRVTLVLEKRQINQEFVRTRWKVFGPVLGVVIACSLTYWITSGLAPPDDVAAWTPEFIAKQAKRPEDTSVFCLDTARPSLWRACLGIGAIFFVFEALSVLTGCAVIRKLRRTAKFSVKTSRMHLQLTRLLVAQILSPVICMFLPIAALCFAVLTNLMNGAFAVYNVDGYVGVTMLSLFPMVNAVLTIFFVAPYRQYTVKWLTFGKVILHKVEDAVDGGSGIHIVSDIAAAYQRQQTTVFVFVQRFKPLNSALSSSS